MTEPLRIIERAINSIYLWDCIESGGEFRARGVSLVEAGFAPAVEDPVDQVIRYCMLFGNQLMTLLAFPHPAITHYLFEYSCHFPLP
ncbi:MAG TPA: hypothetical protein VNN73_20790 [Blastocatellia bacterium]|nr:hypothetical protein [Blastocatellia bacterium]